MYTKTVKSLLEIKVHKIAMLIIGIFLFYNMWYKYAYSERNIILYGTALAATACALYDLFTSRSDIEEVFPMGVLVNLLMCVYSIITGLFVAKNHDVLFSAVKTYAAFSLVCLVICYISHREGNIDWLLSILIAVNISSAIYVLFRGSYYQGYGNVLGPTQNPNDLGLAMNIGLFCLAYKARNNKGKRLLYYGLAVLFCYIIIDCGSRKCLIAAVLTLLAWFIPDAWQAWRKGNWMNRFILLCLVAIILFSIGYYYQRIYINTDIYNRMERLGSDDEGSSHFRKLFYQYALDYFQEHPIFGIGLQQFRVWNPYHAYAHSTYAEAIADWGFIGCSIYFFPVIWAGFELIKKTIAKTDNMTKTVLALFAMEIFLGVGQIWFYEFQHLLIWTIIYLFLKMNPEKQWIKEKQYIYVKA